MKKTERQIYDALKECCEKGYEIDDPISRKEMVPELANLLGIEIVPDKWIFTFGLGHKFGGHYVIFHGDFCEARSKMFDKYGSQWCGQYSEEEWESMKQHRIASGLSIASMETPLQEYEEPPYDCTTVKRCPICANHYTNYPALSRKDNKTYICPECGIKEAMEAIQSMED